LHEIVGRRSIFETIEDETRTHATTQKVVVLDLEARDFLDFVTSGHVGSCNCEIPQQSLLFLIIDVAFTFLKTPTVGSVRSISLNEMFKYFRNKSFSRPFGINLDKLFCETSKSSRPFKEAMDEGMIPSKEFPCK